MGKPNQQAVEPEANLTELGELPPGWTAVPVLNVVEKTQQADPTKRPGIHFKYVDVSSISNESLRIVGFAQHSDQNAPSRARKVVRAGDVIFATVRPYLKRVALVPADLDGQICSTAFCVMRAKPGVLDSNFLYFATSRDSFVKKVAEHQRGSSYPAVTDGDVLRELVPLPPLPAQHAIACVLRTAQQTREATEKVIAAARQLKQSLMHHLFAYGPVPFDQADRVDLRETDHGQVPEAWSIRPLAECAKVQTGVAKGRRIENGEAVEVPYLRVANVQDGYLDLAEIKTITIRRSEAARFLLQAGDVVLTEGGDFDKLGRGFIWNGEVTGCVHQNHIFAVRPNRAILDPHFLAYLTQSAYGKSYFLSVAHKTTNLACINTSKLKALPVLLPDLNEQQKIVAALQAVDRKIEVETKKSRALGALFHTLLHNLMTGRLRVSGLDTAGMLANGTG